MLRNNEDTKEKYKNVENLKSYVLNADSDKEVLKEDIVNAAIAIKLAMNLFEWEAVSYTHLDVYKRQGIYRNASGGRDCD